LSLVYFRIHTPSVFGWSLIGFEYLYWAMTLILAILFDRCLIKSANALPLVVWCFIVLFLGDAIGITGLFSVLVVGLLHVRLLDNSKWCSLALICIIVVCVAIQYSTLSPFPNTRNSISSALVYCIENPEKTLEFIINAYAQSIANFNKPYFFLESTQKMLIKFVGIAAIIMQIYAVIIYFKNKIYLRTTIPLFLMLYSAIAVTGLLLNRLPTFGPENALSPRYIRLFVVGLLGFIWIIADLQLCKATKNDCSLKWCYGLVLFVPLFFIYLVSTTNLWQSSEIYFRYHQKRANGLYQSVDHPDYIMGKENRRCIKHYCDRGILFLKNNKLSLFRQQAPYKSTN
jgi:hypothetical protein